MHVCAIPNLTQTIIGPSLYPARQELQDSSESFEVVVIV